MGIAVYKSLGIGLGFNFDHMSELKPGDKPSTRRLQARAAKSAVRHVQQLYNVQEAQDVLDKIEDPDERERKKVEMRESTQTEIDTIARRLSELIPTDMVLATERRTSIEQFSESSEYERTSSNEYQLKSPRASSPTVRDLLSRTREDDKVDYLNPSGDAKQDGLDDAEPMSQEEEDAFIEAWIQQRSQNKTSDSASEDGEKSDDDGIKTVLV